MRIKKTSATTPVQAQVVNAYNESELNAYSCDYVNDLNTYSTDEVRIGTWMGKPLYRKVLTGSISNGDTLLSNVDTLVNSYGSGLISTRYRMVGFYTYYNNSIYMFAISKNTSNNVLIEIYDAGSSVTATNCNIVLEYTKTND